MCRFSSRTVVTALFVCLAAPHLALAEQPELPPIEAPPEGTAPQSGAFSQTTAAAQPTPEPAADAGPAPAAAPEFLIQMPGGAPDTTPPAASMEPAPATPAPAAPAAPTEPAITFTPTSPAPPTSATPAPTAEATAPAEAPSDLPSNILLPPAGAAPATPTTVEGTTAATKTPAKTVTALSSAPAAAPALPDALAFDEAWRVRLQPFAAIGLSTDLGFPAPTETTLPGATLFTAGAALQVTSGAIAIEGRFSDSLYQQRYLTSQLATQGGLATLDVSEQKMNVDVNIGYEVMHHIDPKVAKGLTLAPYIGGGLRMLISDSLPMNVAGPEVGARVAIAASNSLVIGLGYGFLPNLLSYQGPKLLFGTPRFDHTVDVDLSLRLFGGARAHLSYLSEYMTLTSAYRSYQTVGVGFDYGF
jgi:hypothetical protein